MRSDLFDSGETTFHFTCCVDCRVEDCQPRGHYDLRRSGDLPEVGTSANINLAMRASTPGRRRRRGRGRTTRRQEGGSSREMPASSSLSCCLTVEWRDPWQEDQTLLPSLSEARRRRRVSSPGPPPFSSTAPGSARPHSSPPHTSSLPHTVWTAPPTLTSPSAPWTSGTPRITGQSAALSLVQILSSDWWKLYSHIVLVPRSITTPEAK